MPRPPFVRVVLALVLEGVQVSDIHNHSTLNGMRPIGRIGLIPAEPALSQNSQLEELRKYVDQSGLPRVRRPTFERYTGQKSEKESKSSVPIFFSPIS
jgi:hypothetical protein